MGEQRCDVVFIELDLDERSPDDSAGFTSAGGDARARFEDLYADGTAVDGELPDRIAKLQPLASAHSSHRAGDEGRPQPRRVDRRRRRRTRHPPTHPPLRRSRHVPRDPAPQDQREGAPARRRGSEPRAPGVRVRPAAQVAWIRPSRVRRARRRERGRAQRRAVRRRATGGRRLRHDARHLARGGLRVGAPADG